MRRWISVDGVVTVLLAVNWIWFAFILAVSVLPLLFPAEPVPEPGAQAWPPASPMQQFQIGHDDPNERQNDNPVLFVLVISLTLAAGLMTLADRARREGRRMLAMLAFGGCAAAGLGFVGLQVWRFAEPAFASANRIETFILWNSASSLSLSLLAGLGLLVLSTILMLVRHTGEVPSLAEQAASWHWHALDTFWLILVALAWHWGVMEGL